MAYDEGLAQRVREILQTQTDIEEKRMFGGLAFMVDGYMCCGVLGSELMVRVGPDRYEEALCQSHVREMDFTGKALTGFVYVGEAGLEDDTDLKSWIRQALTYVHSLPEK